MWSLKLEIKKHAAKPYIIINMNDTSEAQVGLRNNSPEVLIH